MNKMTIICADLEGIFVPEIWINVAKNTGIKELKLTTRDIPDYNVLMKKRLKILDDNNLKLSDITYAIEQIEPMEGAVDFINWIRSWTQIIVLSDTFTQFAQPLMKKLGYPVLFCNSLSVAADDTITGYNLRQKQGKKDDVIALKNLNYNIIAFGDSYNDIGMLKEADTGILFRPPENVIAEYPEFPVTHDYEELKKLISHTNIL